MNPFNSSFRALQNIRIIRRGSYSDHGLPRDRSEGQVNSVVLPVCMTPGFPYVSINVGTQHSGLQRFPSSGQFAIEEMIRILVKLVWTK